VEREATRRDVLQKGYSEARETFTQHYQTDAVDASLLLTLLMGFLPVDDPRVASTIQAIERDLLRGGVVLRYVANDGLVGQEQGFLICLFWYLNGLILQR
jgi:GH15 family glucan-1,4-alpha-glucosidase